MSHKLSHILLCLFKARVDDRHYIPYMKEMKEAEEYQGLVLMSLSRLQETIVSDMNFVTPGIV